MADILNIIINTSSWVMTVVLFVLIIKNYKEHSKVIEKLEDEIQEKKGK